MKFFESFQQFSNLNSKLNNSIKFGYIDTSNNGIENGFPNRIEDPLVTIFPKENKNLNGIILYGIIDRDVLINAICSFTSNKKFMGGIRPFRIDIYENLMLRLNYLLKKVSPRELNNIKNQINIYKLIQEGKKNDEL